MEAEASNIRELPHRRSSRGRSERSIQNRHNNNNTMEAEASNIRELPRRRSSRERKGRTRSRSQSQRRSGNSTSRTSGGSRSRKATDERGSLSKHRSQSRSGNSTSRTSGGSRSRKATDERGSPSKHRSQSRSKNRLEDAKANERSRSRGELTSSNHSSKNEQAKKGAQSGSGNSRPGASHETSSSDWIQQKGRNNTPMRHESRSKSREGLQRSRSRGSLERSSSHRSNPSNNGSSRSLIDKKGHRSRGATTPSVQNERNAFDRARNKRSGRSRSRSYNENNIASNEEVPLAAMMVEDDDQNKGREAAELRQILQDQEAKLREQDSRLRREEEEREHMERKTKKRQKTICVIAIFMLFVAGGVGTYVMLQGSTKNTEFIGSGSDVDGEETNITSSPTTAGSSATPSTNPTGAPTEFIKYDPPTPEDCQRLADGLPPLDMETLDTRNFEVTVDLGLSNADVDISTLLPELEQKIEDWLVSALIGCPVDSAERRLIMAQGGIRGGESRRLENIRWMFSAVDDVSVVFDGELCEPTISPMCGIIRILLGLGFRGDERNFSAVLLLSEFFRPNNQDLRDTIGFSDAVDTFIVKGTRSTSPTMPPTRNPTETPSIAPTDSPTMVESSNPTFAPVDTPVTMEPTKAPTVGATPAPSSTPPPTPNPTKTPTAPPTFFPTPTPPPTLPDATPFPTQSPSRSPTGFPTPVPTSAPSSMPTFSPSANPSQQPSSQPSGTPSHLPSIAPSARTCFQTNSELADAVSNWFDNDAGVIEAQYGPMGDWCFGPGVTSMNGLFGGRSNFDEDISGWDVSSVTTMQTMFGRASSFNQDLSSWDVSSVTNMQDMFAVTSSFNGDVSTWDVSSVTTMQGMFWQASSFNQDLSAWNVSSVTSMYAIFGSASSFNGDLSTWDVSSVTNMRDMFRDASSFNHNLCAWGSRLQTTASTGNAFLDATSCPSQSDPDLSANPPGPFCHVCSSQTCFETNSELADAVSNWFDNDAGVIEAQYGPMGDWCFGLGVTSMDELFLGRSNFNEDISGWDVSSVTNMYAIFFAASSFNQDLSTWDVSSVTNMSRMFQGASSFNQDLSTWDVSSVTQMGSMFQGASSFNQDLSTWDVSSVANMGHMFYAAYSFNQDLSTWDVSSVTLMHYMFNGAESFNQNLCDWGSKLQSTVNIGSNTFTGATSCPTQATPNLSTNPPGPFCHVC